MTQIPPFSMAPVEEVFGPYDVPDRHADDGKRLTFPAGMRAVDLFLPVLDDLALHASLMDRNEDAWHDDCKWCDAIVLLSRLGDFGRQIRATPEYKGRK